MWFRQAQLFKFEDKSSFDAKELEDQLEQLAFTPCPSGLPLSQGWISPTDEEDTSLVYVVKDFLLICLQTEAKLLPATIVRQKLNEKIKSIQLKHDRKVSYKEKNMLKQEVYNELLPLAFGVLYRTYAFIDTKNNWLILDTNNAKRTENFITFFKRSLSKIKITSPEIKKLSPILTRWLLDNDHPKSLNIEDACVLQDPKQIERSIRIQKQDLSSNYVQPILKNDFEISQMKMTWNDQITFVLKNDFTFQSLQYQDSVVELTGEDKNDEGEGSFRTDFFIMGGILTKMFQEFLKVFAKTGDKKA
jgi:recombination associated protein RdgC